MPCPLLQVKGQDLLRSKFHSRRECRADAHERGFGSSRSGHTTSAALHVVSFEPTLLLSTCFCMLPGHGRLQQHPVRERGLCSAESPGTQGLHGRQVPPRELLHRRQLLLPQGTARKGVSFPSLFSLLCFYLSEAHALLLQIKTSPGTGVKACFRHHVAIITLCMLPTSLSITIEIPDTPDIPNVGPKGLDYRVTLLLLHLPRVTRGHKASCP